MNNLNGTVPFKNCDDFQVLSSDCSQPITITCPCCTRCFGFFTVKEDVLPCLSSILQVKPFERKGLVNYFVENNNSQLIAEHYSSYRNKDFIETCILLTDCMTLTGYSRLSSSLSVDGTILFHDVFANRTGTIYRVSFSYSSDGTMKPNTCDSYTICNQVLCPGTPQRNLFNLVTRFSGVVSFSFLAQGNVYTHNCMY